MSSRNYWRLGLLLIGFAAASGASKADSPTSAPFTAMDLSKPFDTRSAWRLTATQDPAIDDPIESGGEKLPGAIHLCLGKGPARVCEPHLNGAFGAMSKDDAFGEFHYLNKVSLIYPRGKRAAPLLWVQTASLHSGDGNQSISTQVFAYQKTEDEFVSVYEYSTGKNNNQEVRYIDAGPLAGRIISVEPTSNKPFAFWVTVNALTPDSGYKPVMRYRSATRYGDSNPLPVIDSEMPNMQQQLGLWRAGSALPLPAGPCPRPRLLKKELWCQ